MLSRTALRTAARATAPRAATRAFSVSAARGYIQENRVVEQPLSLYNFTDEENMLRDTGESLGWSF